MKQGKEKKKDRIKKEEVKILLFVDDMMLYIENPRLHQKN